MFLYLVCRRAVDRDLDDLQPAAGGVFERAGRAAGPAVKCRDEDARGIDHVAVAAHHAPGGVGLLHERLIIALAQVVFIARAQLRPPAVGLTGEGDGRLDRDLGVLQAQKARSVEKIQVAAVGHAADEVADAGGVDGVHGVEELLLQLAAAGVVLVAAPACIPGGR